MKKLMADFVLFFLSIIINILGTFKMNEKGFKPIESRERLITKFSPNNEIDYDYKISEQQLYDVSIIVPVYNSEKTILKCIESIANQNTKYTYEIILINDGSTDKSLEIIKNYANNNEKIVIKEQENGGASKARNIGISLARGRYVSFVDSDDYIAENFIEVLMDYAIKYKAEFVKTGIVEFESDSSKIIRKNKNKLDIIDVETNPDKIRNIKGHACGSIIKKAIFEDIRFPEGFWYEDLIMRLIIMRKCSKIVTIDRELYYYRIYNTSTSRNKENKKSYKTLSQYFLLENVIEKYKNLKLEKDYFYYSCLIHELGCMMWLRTRYLDKETRREVFNCSRNLWINEGKNLYYKLDGIEKKLVLSFEKNNFLMWKLVSIYKMIEVKFY